MKKEFSKGKANQRSLADRMKTYEEVTTSSMLVEKLPIYARIDMRAGHSFCRGLVKPFDAAYVDAMRFATAHVVEKTGAIVGYCQSDEASFVWEDDTKIPFGARLFKLESVLASMFTAAFFKACIGTKLEDKAMKMLPSFDCRVCNLPSMLEAANMLLWRQRDSIKNSITLLALEHFSTKQLDKKSGEDKIKMLREEKRVNYFKAIPEDLRLGAFFKREVYEKILTDDDLMRIPEKNWPPADDEGKRKAVRSHVIEFKLGKPLDEIQDKVSALFGRISSETSLK